MLLSISSIQSSASSARNSLEQVCVGCVGEMVGLEEALLASVAEHQGTNSRPPAAQSAVRSLRREHLTAERLRELGDDMQCSVCRCSYRALMHNRG